MNPKIREKKATIKLKSMPLKEMGCRVEGKLGILIEREMDTGKRLVLGNCLPETQL